MFSLYPFFKQRCKDSTNFRLSEEFSVGFHILVIIFSSKTQNNWPLFLQIKKIICIFATKINIITVTVYRD